ncbi:hypothetical protein PTTG_27657 [Puccinia triticina 1-1 BBBD Race 1]|uniref:hAT-like transposase RNase-H fold domain-containing protein n=1 Tax=Puccinia triticina (isolate 1-1 / race 1 (BBBD)) TaxID=630390 RepID=A0A180GI26_PUCT1|nr:hypothetical protein PTTG_27657 [Puccinia triticina 1-1 BBBD Race 1]
MAPQLTQSNLNKDSEPHAGDITNQSQTHRRRSRRSASIVIAPGMVPNPTDPCVKQTRPAPSKRVVDSSPSSDSSDPSVQGKKKKKTTKRRKRKSPAKENLPPLDPDPSGKTPKQSGTGKKKKLGGVTKKANPTEAGHDYDQETDEGSVEIVARKKKEEKKSLYNDVLQYFEEPVCNETDSPDNPLSFKCKWCPAICRGHGSLRGNLKSHRDGYTQKGKSDKGCPNRQKAILAGDKLPPSVAKVRAATVSSIDNKQPGISVFMHLGAAFDVRVLNQLIILWQIWQALPWSRIEDPYLWAAFKYCNQKAHLYGRRWAADEAKILYASLKTSVFDELHKLDTKFTLIHDVWTTKGNRFAFIGAAVAYINSNWEYCTTDSGSNNNTMASHMHELICDSPNGQSRVDAWDPTNSHVRCFCHKLALIVNAGLAALLLKTLPPGKTKESVLGFFPVLGRLSEAPEPDGSTETVPPAKEVAAVGDGDDDGDQELDSASDYGNADDEDDKPSAGGGNAALETEETAEDPSAGATPSKHLKSLKLQELCKKLDTVIKQITRSAAQRANFDKIAREMNIKVAPLIAGYGIRWNIKYQSYCKAVDAREVIDRILKDDQEPNSAGIFEDVFFLPRDWKEIDNLNCELEVFVKLTSYMEGNQPTGAHVIPKYLKLKESLTKKLDSSLETDSLYPMYHAMVKRVDKYLYEAMQCHTLILATILHPCYRMHLFELAFGLDSSEVAEAMKLLNQEFGRTKERIELDRPAAQTVSDSKVMAIDRPTNAPPQSLMARLASRLTHQTPQENEIDT